MLAMLCTLAWPDDVMTSELQCRVFKEDPPRVYQSRVQCDRAARQKLTDTLAQFESMDVEFESLQIGCEPSE